MRWRDLGCPVDLLILLDEKSPGLSETVLQLLAPADPGLGRGFPEKGLKNSSSSESDSEETELDSIDILLSRLPSQASWMWCDFLTFAVLCRLFFDPAVLWIALAGAERILK